jgi:Sigma-70, region 4
VRLDAPLPAADQALSSQLASLVDENDGPEVHAEWSELEELIHGLVVTLTAEEKAVVYLRYVEDRTFKEIGAKLGKKTDWVWRVHVKALQRMATIGQGQQSFESLSGLIQKAKNASERPKKFADVQPVAKSDAKSSDTPLTTKRCLKRLLFRDSLEYIDQNRGHCLEAHFLTHVASLVVAAAVQLDDPSEEGPAAAVPEEIAFWIMQHLLSSRFLRKTLGNELVLTDNGARWLDSARLGSGATHKLGE